jgi:hypothetical protein
MSGQQQQPPPGGYPWEQGGSQLQPQAGQASSPNGQEPGSLPPLPPGFSPWQAEECFTRWLNTGPRPELVTEPLMPLLPWLQARLAQHRTQGAEPPGKHTDLRRITALQLVRFGPESARNALEMAADATTAGQIMAEAAAWEPGELLMHYRAFLKADRDSPHILQDSENELELRKARARQNARLLLEAEQFQAAIGERKITSYAELIAQPRPPWIMDGLLTQGVYGLAGPPEAGKSLLCRDWLISIAAGGGNVLYALSEGQHDLAERFGAISMIQAASPRLAFFDAGLSLASQADVDWLIEQYQEPGVKMIVFDMIYGFGVSDDEHPVGVGPVLGGCKRLATELGCAVLLTGHPGHNGERRFRGSSMWRGAFDGEFHMGNGEFSCVKHKYTDKRKIHWSYVVEYPYLRVLDEGNLMDRHMKQIAQISQDIKNYPDDSISARARRLAPQMGLTVDHIRKLIRSVQDGPEGQQRGDIHKTWKGE